MKEPTEKEIEEAIEMLKRVSEFVNSMRKNYKGGGKDGAIQRPRS